MDLISQINVKPIYRVTGTPENFLTALRHFTWGFNNVNDWNNLQQGDLIFFHSKASDSKFLKKSPSCVVGMGIVGNNFFIDATPLWIDEKIDEKKYPYRFSFSEVCVFSEIPINDDWDTSTLNKMENTVAVINRLLENRIPMSELEGFPMMGSYSLVRNENVKKLLLELPRELTLYKNNSYLDLSTKEASQLKEVTSKYEAHRYATSLTVFDDIKKKVINKSSVSVNYSLDDLRNAEEYHSEILTHLLGLFRDKEYKTFINNRIDLFVHNGKNALLIEAKSIENKNFHSQSRNGIAKLFEYNYFEVSKYKKENSITFEKEYKLLATSAMPEDGEYVKFINSLDIKTLAVRNQGIITYGESIDVSRL
jgi:hypothetical protein